MNMPTSPCSFDRKGAVGVQRDSRVFVWVCVFAFASSPLNLCADCLCCPVAIHPKRKWACGSWCGVFRCRQQFSENHLTPNHKVNVNLSPRKPLKPARPQLPVKSLNVCRSWLFTTHFQMLYNMCMCTCNRIQRQVYRHVWPVRPIYRNIIKICSLSKSFDALCTFHASPYWH